MAATVTEPEDSKGARKTAQALLNALEVNRLIVVDDDYLPSAATVIAKGRDRPLAARPEIPGLSEPPEDGDEWAHDAEAAWNELSPRDRILAYDRMRPKNRPLKYEIPTSGVGLGALADLVESVEGMPLTAWREHVEEICTTASERPTLVLFDVDFSKEGLRDTEGLAAIQDLMRRDCQIATGLLTATASIDDIDEIAAKYASAIGISRSKLVLAGKNQLDPARLDEFVLTLRRTALVPRLDELREAVSDAMSQGLHQAIDRLKEMDSAVVEELVLHSAFREGAWEPDVIIRILHVWQRDHSRQKLLQAREASSLTTLTRRLSQVHIEQQDATADQAAEIHALERFDAPAYVNALGFPIENGDIFCTASGDCWVLVAQPCDIMLRSEGGRTHDPATATLLPVRGRRTDQGSKGQSVLSFFALPEPHDLGTDMVVEFVPAEHVRFDVLDLCSFNSLGQANIAKDGDPEVPALTQGLERRWSKLQAAARSGARKREKLATALEGDPPLKHEVLQTIAGHGSGPFKPALDDPDRLAFDCRRKARLATPYADALLNAYTNALSRSVHAHDLWRLESA